MSKYRIFSVLLILVIAGLGYFVYASETMQAGFASRFPFRLGLDLAGGTELTYSADTSKVPAQDVGSSMESLRDVIERRVNLFGVSEPVVQIERASTLSGTGADKLIVELPGVTDIEKAVELIGKTPTLEFKLLKQGISERILSTTTASTSVKEVYENTELTGRYLKHAQVGFNQQTNAPVVDLEFNDLGRDLFARITSQNVGRVLAIFLDGEPISTPVIREEIRDGKAQISGTFNVAEARTLVRDLNYGSLPVPVTLASTQSVGASLGSEAVHAGIKAGIYGFLIVALFLILWYRLPGIIATLSLVLYILISLFVFKLIPVTLSAAGIAGFILSIGMAVDANILIFERMKEELKRGKPINEAMHEGFHRAWLSIRDSNISSIITAIVLFWLGTSAVKGFALTLGIGVAISMFTAITASRSFLYAIAPKTERKIARFLFSNGLHIEVGK